MSEDEPERPAENWKYPYVGGAVDFGGGIQVSVTKAGDRAVGYAISPTIYISRNDRAALGLIDEFCEQHGISTSLRETGASYQLEVAKRDDIRTLVSLIEPYLVVMYEPSIHLNALLAGLDDGKGSTKEGFVELMGYVDKIRETARSGGGVKYDQAHFREEWDL